MKKRKTKIRVLQLIAAPEMGGIENQLLAFLQRYDREKFVVEVLCGTSTDGQLREKYLETETKLALCQWSRYVIPYIWRLLKALSRGNYDVVHARSAEVSGASILAAWLMRVPNRVASYHHTETAWSRPGIANKLAIKTLQWITRRCATKIYGISEVALDAYFSDWRHFPHKFLVCHNGINTENFSALVNLSYIRKELGIAEGSLVIGHVGSFRKVKNHETIIKIAEHVLKERKDVSFLLIGEGSLRQKIEKEVAKRNMSGHFVFTGNRHDIPPLLSAMNVFVVPSLNEGFATVITEAQAAGLPVVASDLPSIREALSPEMHKFCCNPLDSKSMAEHILLLLQNPSLRKELGSKGRAYAIEKFSIEKTVKQLESIYLNGLQ